MSGRKTRHCYYTQFFIFCKTYIGTNFTRVTKSVRRVFTGRSFAPYHRFSVMYAAARPAPTVTFQPSPSRAAFSAGCRGGFPLVFWRKV